MRWHQHYRLKGSDKALVSVSEEILFLEWICRRIDKFKDDDETKVVVMIGEIGEQVKK
jgi:hypothetical protein